jgi:hypothetical protein
MHIYETESYNDKIGDLTGNCLAVQTISYDTEQKVSPFHIQTPT